MNKSFAALGGAVLVSVTLGNAHAGGINFTNIIDPLNPTFTQALGINGSGVVVGYGNSSIFNGFQVTRSFAAGKFVRENFPNQPGGTQVIGIDAAGDTVGFYVDAVGGNHGFFKPAGGLFTTVDRPNTAFNQLLGINQAGNEIAGYSSTDSHGAFLQQAFFLSGGVYTDINALLPGPINSQATGVNNAGVVVGFYQITPASPFTGFEDMGGTISTITVPGSLATQPFGINDQGAIVGDYVGADGLSHGFFDTGGMFTTFDPPGSTGTTINGIDDNGHMVGFYARKNGDVIGFITGVPEPATLILFGSGLAGLALVRRWHHKST